MTETLIIIPARMGSSRLPGKPLADIAGKPLIVHVWQRGMDAQLGPVFVACDDERIAQAITEAGGNAILTEQDHASGTDRVFEALNRLDPGHKYQKIVNLQGDVPFISPKALRATAGLLDDEAVSIGTLGTPIHQKALSDNPNIVKIIGTDLGQGRYRALFFARAPASHGLGGQQIRHIGIYAYQRAALSKFSGLPATLLEQRERLEQLRAIEAGMRIDFCLIDAAPADVDTPADLDEIRQWATEKITHNGN